jgi:hypothetical protein
LFTILLAAAILEAALSANNHHRQLARAKGFAAETRAEKMWALRESGVRAFPQVVTKEVVSGLPGRAFDDGERPLLPLDAFDHLGDAAVGAAVIGKAEMADERFAGIVVVEDVLRRPKTLLRKMAGELRDVGSEGVGP